MKKLLLIMMCFLLVEVVNAKTLTKEEIIDGFMNSSGVKETNALGDETKRISMVDNTTNETLDVAIGGVLSRTYTYSEGYIHFVDDREITEQSVEDQVYDFLFLGMLTEGVLTKSGIDVSKLKPMADNFEFNFDLYNVSITAVPYDLGGNNKGDFIRDYKIGFDTEKLNAFANAVGFVEEGSTTIDKVPTVKLLSKDKNTVSLSIYVEETDPTKQYTCNVYRSTNKDSGYESVFSEAFACNDKNAIYLDTGLKENTKYYYKAMVVGGTSYSNILEVVLGSSTNTNTNTNVVNPKTGTNQFIPLIIGLFASIIVLFIFHKNSGIKL